METKMILWQQFYTMTCKFYRDTCTDFVWSTSQPGIETAKHHWNVIHPGGQEITDYHSQPAPGDITPENATFHILHREILPQPGDQLRLAIDADPDLETLPLFSQPKPKETKILPGDQITIEVNYRTRSGIVSSAHNYGKSPDAPDWYIELTDPRHGQVYWKQGLDGGEITNHTPASK